MSFNKMIAISGIVGCFGVAIFFTAFGIALAPEGVKKLLMVLAGLLLIGLPSLTWALLLDATKKVE